MTTLIPILLAGGSGSRLSPLSTAAFPKQFLILPDQRHSMFQHSVQHALELTDGPILVVAPQDYQSQIQSQLAELGVALSRFHVLLEPRAGGTAAAVSAAALYAATLDASPVLWVLPCDHDRRAPLHLQDYAPRVQQGAQAGKIITFGLPPQSPDSGYGYLRVDESGEVLQFIEKPETSMAAALIATGQAWWNSGMFAFSAATLLAEMANHHPAMLDSCRKAFEAARIEQGLVWLAESHYGQESPEPIDRVIMERSDQLVMYALPASGWADIGTFSRLLAWWETHAPSHTSWDFGSGRLWTKQAVSDASL